MKITCPNDPTHNEFEVRMPVEEIWIVDREGEIEDQYEGDGAIYKEIHECLVTCLACGVVATTEKE